jgi:hypothetical protein
MKLSFSRTALMAILFLVTGMGFAQTTGITSGAIHAINSESSSRLLDVRDASPAVIADKVFEAWHNIFNIESLKGFWDNAEIGRAHV